MKPSTSAAQATVAAGQACEPFPQIGTFIGRLEFVLRRAEERRRLQNPAAEAQEAAVAAAAHSTPGAKASIQ